MRHAASRYIKDAGRRRRRQVSLSRAGPLADVEARPRTATLPSARTDSRNRIAQLRQSLPAEDQTLLILRVNRQLGWKKDSAQVMAYEGQTVADAVLEKEAVRLRKRYQLAKDKLRRMIEQQGGASTPRER